MDLKEREEAREDDNSAIENIYDIFRKMLTDERFSQENLKCFQDKFFNPKIWERYKSLRENLKVKNNQSLEKHRDELVEYMRQIALKEGYDEYAAELVCQYFRTVGLLDKRMYLASNKTN